MFEKYFMTKKEEEEGKKKPFCENVFYRTPTSLRLESIVY